MGLGNKLIVSATGFPGTNKTLRFIQDAFREPLGALAQLAGDKTIITGVVNTAGVVSNGFITYNGEIIPFVGGSYATTVTIIEVFENANYNTDADNNQQLDSLPAYRTIYAKCGTGGIDLFNFNELKPLKTIDALTDFTGRTDIVFDANYVHTDYNFTLALLNKLNGIEDNAQVNVKTDWEAAIGSATELLNKPMNLVTYLRKGYTYLGDFPGNIDGEVLISFPALETTNYVVVGSLRVLYGVDANQSNDVIWTIADKTTTSFRLIGKDTSSGVGQNLYFDYFLLKL